MALKVRFCLPLQGSLDNISIIIVCFPGAPQVSQEALQQEAELEHQIDVKVEGDFLYIGLNLLRPGVHMREHHILGYITTVGNSAQLGPCDYICRGLAQILRGKVNTPNVSFKKTMTLFFLPEIIQMMRSKEEDPDLLYVIKFLAAEEMPGLPPGGGITSK